MEVTAAERTTIYTNISPLAQRVNNYIQTQHSSIAAVAKDIGYSRTTVSRYLTGKYDSNPNDLESKLTAFASRLSKNTGVCHVLPSDSANGVVRSTASPVCRVRKSVSLLSRSFGLLSYLPVRAGTRRPCSVYARAVKSTLASAS